MSWFFSKKCPISIENITDDIPKPASEERLNQNVSRLWEAHDHFTKVLREFTEDVQKQTTRGSK